MAFVPLSPALDSTPRRYPARRAIVRAAGGILGALGFVVMSAGVAGAHVTVDKSEVPAGSFQQLTFSVGHGCEGSPTTTVAVRVPEGTASITPEAPAGWAVSVDDRVVTWQGGPLPDHQLQRFTVSLKTPDQPGTRAFFPVVQTCAVGQTDWISEWDGSGEEPEHPAPALQLTDGSSAEGEHGHDGDAAGISTTVTTAGESDEAEDSDEVAGNPISADTDDSDGTTLAVLALVVGGLGLLTGVAALVTARRRT